MNDTNFENNTEINSVHSEAKAQGHGGVKAMAIFFAITTLALGSALAYVYTSKNKDTKKLNEELVESKEKVKSANESIAKYEEATQTKITDVKQDNVTVKEIVKPMKIDAQMEQLTKALYDKSHKNDAFDDDQGHKIIESWETPVFDMLFTTSDGKFMIARIRPLGIGVYIDQHGNRVNTLPFQGGYAAYWYRSLPDGQWKLGEEGHAPHSCNTEIANDYKEAIRSVNNDRRKNGEQLFGACFDENKHEYVYPY